MSKNTISRRGFLKGMVKTTAAAVLANVIKFVPEAQGVLAKDVRDGVVVPEGVKAEPLSKRAYKEALNKVWESPDGQILLRFFEGKGYSAQLRQAVGYSFMTDRVQTIGLLIPFSGGGKACLVAADFGSSIMVGGGIAQQEGSVQVIELYDVTGGELTKYVVEQRPDGTLLNRATGEVGVQSPTSCGFCSFVCGLIKGTSCSILGAALCFFVAAACFPYAAPECFVLCMAIWLLVCYNLGTPCPDLCLQAGYCP